MEKPNKMANNEDIQNGFLTEIEPLLRNSDYYIAQKGYIKIPKYRASQKKRNIRFCVGFGLLLQL